MDLRCVVAVLSKISLGRPWDHWVPHVAIDATDPSATPIDKRDDLPIFALRSSWRLHKTNQPFAYHVNVWAFVTGGCYGVCGACYESPLLEQVTGKDIPILIFLSTEISTIPELIITNRCISIPMIFCKRWSKIQFYIVLLFFLPIQFFLDQGRSPLPMASPWQSCARSWSWSCKMWLWFFRGQPQKKIYVQHGFFNICQRGKMINIDKNRKCWMNLGVPYYICK